MFFFSSCFFCLTLLWLECSRSRKTASFLTSQFSVIWVKWKQSVSPVTLPYSSIFHSLFLSFFVLEIFKSKYDKSFVRHSAFISKFEWFEQSWYVHLSWLVPQVHMIAGQNIKKKYLICQIPIKMLKQHAVPNSSLHNLTLLRLGYFRPV